MMFSSMIFVPDGSKFLVEVAVQLHTRDVQCFRPSSVETTRLDWSGFDLG
jgi:hypothetical protein